MRTLWRWANADVIPYWCVIPAFFVVMWGMTWVVLYFEQ